jgi:hypothetical protein
MTVSLFTYMQSTQRFLREHKQEFVNPADLVSNINDARRVIALETQCIRVLTPVSGPVVQAKLIAGGSGYTNPSVTITPPDYPSGVAPNPSGQQATAQANLQGNVISDIVILNGGDGYFQPQGQITDPTGTGASFTLTVQPFNQVNQGQEVYNFSDIDLSRNTGCRAVFAVRSISLIYANYRYSLPVYPFSVYQAAIRQFPFAYQYVPTFASQFGQGVSGSLYFYPLPSQVYQCEFDCQCLPEDLSDNQSYEAIPEPWTELVKYYAASLAMIQLQNYNASKFFEGLYNAAKVSYSNSARIGRAVNPYGRY